MATGFSKSGHRDRALAQLRGDLCEADEEAVDQADGEAGAWLPCGVSAMPRCAPLASSLCHARKAPSIGLSLACPHQVGGGRSGFLSHLACAGEGTAAPHGGSEKAQLGPLCPHPRDLADLPRRLVLVALL